MRSYDEIFIALKEGFNDLKFDIGKDVLFFLLPFEYIKVFLDNAVGLDAIESIWNEQHIRTKIEVLKQMDWHLEHARYHFNKGNNFKSLLMISNIFVLFWVLKQEDKIQHFEEKYQIDYIENVLQELNLLIREQKKSKR